MPWASTLQAAMVHASRAWTYSQTRCMVMSLSNVSRCEGWCVTWGDTPLAKAHKPPLYRKEDLCVALFSSLLFDALVPSRRAQSSIGPGSCIRPLRIIPLVPKPGKMPSSHNDLRGIAMVPHRFYYQLALLAIIWLFVMLHLSWPRRSAPRLPRRPRSSSPSVLPRPKRSRA